MYMDVKIKLNGKLIIDSVDQDMVLLDFCRKQAQLLFSEEGL